MNENKKSLLAPMLAICILPAMYLLRAGADNYLYFTLGAVLTLLPEGVLLILLGAAFYKKEPMPLPVTLPLLTALGLFFGVMPFITVGGLSRLNSYFSSPYVGSLLVTMLILLSGLYIAFLSEGAVRRLCSAVLLIVLALFSAAVLTAIKSGELTNLHLYSPAPAEDIKRGLLAGALIFEPDLYYLTLCLTRGRQGGWGRFLAAKAGLILLFTLPVIYVLGEHAKNARLPAYELAAFSKSVLIERFNGLFMMCMTLAAIVKTALEMHALKLCAMRLSVRRGANEKA